MKKITKQFNSSEYLKNEVIFKLLTTLPSFQKDIEDIRKEVGVPRGGFNRSEDEKYIEWYHREFVIKTTEIIDSKLYIEETKKINSNQDYLESIRQKWKLADSVPLFRMKHRVDKLGERYKLPQHFYNDNHVGIFQYIVFNSLSFPSNNWCIEQNPEGRRGTTKWLSIRTFSPLSKKELKDAFGMLSGLQKHYLPANLTVTTRTKEQFDRDLEIFRELGLNRNKKPVRLKKHSGYLSYAKKQVTKKELKRLERIHPDDVNGLIFDEKTSREIGKKFSMTSEAVRKSLQRTYLLIKNFFGEEYFGR